jgi:hypothetical protein
MTILRPQRAAGLPAAWIQGACIALFCLLFSSVSLAQTTAPSPATPAASSAPAPEGSVGGMGDINLYPKRVVLQGRDRIASVGLFNRAASEGRYDIVVSDMMMTPLGNIVELGSVENPEEKARVKTASALLRWSPRKIVLPASAAQTVRIMARIPPDLPPGEYRSHFSVVQIPPGGEGGGFSVDDMSEQSASRSVGVRITPRFGISIPVIVRVGETTVQAGLRDLAVKTLSDGRKVVALTITRSGTRSAYGDITVMAPGQPKPVAIIKGIGVYPEVDSRPVNVPIDLNVPASAYAPGAKLMVTYTDDDYRPGEILARQDFVVP